MSNNTKFRFNRKSMIGIAAGSVAAVVIALLFTSSTLLTDEIDVMPTQTENNPSVAEVNGQEITLDEVRDAMNVQALQGQQLDVESALDLLITKTLLLEEAQDRDIVVTVAEADEVLTENYVQNGLSLQQFEERLGQLGTTYEQTLESYREQMIINKVFADEISNVNIQVNDKEAKTFFEDNIDAIKMQVGNNTIFDDVSSQIKATIIQQKQQQVVFDFVEDLKDSATIITYGNQP